jgi:hypothetical protein
VVKEEAVRRALQPKELVDATRRKRAVFITDETWNASGIPWGKEPEEND